jgi:hypothetical protein
MIEAQASAMGFREGFLLVAVGFLAALFPACFMRPRRLAQPSGGENAVERTGPPRAPRQASSAAS